VAIVTHLGLRKAQKIRPEIVVDNFSAIECDLTFFVFIRALCQRHAIHNILDYGAGRNYYISDFNPERQSYFIKDLRDLRFNGAHVTAVDVDPAVLTHPSSDVQKVIDTSGKLDLPDESFDLIVSDMVFEHIENPAIVSSELQRVLKPGGWMIVRTPNVLGYMTLASSLVPNRLHTAVLRMVQPNRKAQDTFPTFYRLNSLAGMRKHFSNCSVVKITDSWEPAYFFGKTWLYHLFSLLHKFMPKAFGTAHVFIVQKNQAAAAVNT
jgi:SAM-dependent methyltransferase